MIDWTYTHFRVLMRLLAPQALLYTEMLSTGAILNNPQKVLVFNPIEAPLAIQLGGAALDDLVKCARIAEAAGFAEINLNLGCPSPKVLAGRFGACLMAEPDHVQACIAAIKHAVSIPVSAKIRIGIDHQDSYEFFAAFVHKLIDAGCDKLIIHARKAWLRGLSPKQNRTIPPINYSYVYAIKKSLPHIPMIINGDIKDIVAIKLHLEHVDGVMLGRLACLDPYAIASIHHVLYPDFLPLTRTSILEYYANYAERAYLEGASRSALLKPIFNFYHGIPGARSWKLQLQHLQQSDNFNLSDVVAKFIVKLDTIYL